MASKGNKSGKSKAKPAATKKATTKPTSTSKVEGKFRIVVGGPDFDLDVVEIEGDGGQLEKALQELQRYERLKDERREGAGRLNLSAAIVGATLIALIVAATWGWMHADFSGVSSVWAVASVPLGWVAGHFFKSHGRTVTHG